VHRYFFDTRDGETFIEDDEGQEMPDLESVRIEATRSLAELARDVLPGSLKRVLTVEVRRGRWPLLKLCLTFEAIPLTKAA
jgi:hypothetical protein